MARAVSTLRNKVRLSLRIEMDILDAYLGMGF